LLWQQSATYAASIELGREEAKLEWVADSDDRFFPAVNGSCVSRRDIVDLLSLHETVLSQGGPRFGRRRHSPSASTANIESPCPKAVDINRSGLVEATHAST
jgi:hypothetical protein